jgi:hypothetical protein
MMRGRNNAVAEAPERPVVVGDRVAGLRIERILSRRPERYDLVEAAAPDGKRVALQLFAPALGDDGELRERILRLAGLAESIEPPLLGVLGALNVGGGRLGLGRVSPRGRTLAALLRPGPLERDATVGILSQVAGALETAAALGLPPGELAPEDIFVTGGRPRQALLADFGIGVLPHRGCESPTTIEGADYRAPETVRGAPIEPASTVYALTCILVECLTGAPPYPYDRPLLTLHAHLTEPPPRVTERRDGLPSAIDEVVASGMSKYPQQRPASPTTLLRAVQRALGVKAPIPVTRTSKRPKRAARPAPEQPRKRRAEPQDRARARARAHHPPRPARRQRPGLRGPVAVGLGFALLASTAGFAAGSNLGTTAKPKATAAAAQPRDEYVRAVGLTAKRLDAQRATARRKLRNARSASAQAAAAAALATAYREAGDAVTSAPQAPAGDARLAARLRRAEGAYGRLSRAARHHDKRAFQAAALAVVRRERELDRALAQL